VAPRGSLTGRLWHVALATICAATVAAVVATGASGQNVIDSISEEFPTFTSALEATGINDTLGGEGPYTVLVPSEEAFADLDEDERDDLLADAEGDLRGVVEGNVIEGEELTIASITDGQEATTLDGETVEFSKDDEGNVSVDGANVEREIDADNGTILVTDEVLGVDGGEASNWWWWLLLLLIPLAALLYWLTRRRRAPAVAPGDTTRRATTAAVADVDDDFTRIPGVGDEIANALKGNGIGSFAALAATSVETLRSILSRAGLLDKVNPEMLKEAAQLASEGKWDELRSRFTSLI
jgi:uncharacterized surface protein with fasciclin (FAS1) repeats